MDQRKLRLVCTLELNGQAWVDPGFEKLNQLRYDKWWRVAVLTSLFMVDYGQQCYK